MFVIKGKEFKYSIKFPESNGELPEFSVYTSQNQLFITGLGELIETDTYEAIITIPVSAPSSTFDNQYNIEWKYGTVKKIMYFDVKDPDVSDDEVFQRELFKFALPNKNYNARIIIPERPSDIECSLYQGNRLLTEIEADDPIDHRLGTQLTCEIESAYLKIGEYTLIWLTDIDDYYQIITVPPISILPVISKIRFLVDRVIKKIEEPQVYLDSDILAAIYGGIEYINAWTPVTAWTISDIPAIIKPFIMYAGAWYLLNSQFMLESDLAVSYNDQSVSMDYDRTGPIESEISRMQEYMSEHLTNAKTNALKNVTLGTIGLTTSGLGPGLMDIRKNLRLIRRRG